MFDLLMLMAHKHRYASNIAVFETFTVILQCSTSFQDHDTEAILFGTDQRLRSINHSTGVDVVGSVVKFTLVTLDSSLSFDRHITEVCRSCHFHIRALRHIRPLLTNDAAISVANSIVSSRLDYCNVQSAV